MARREQKKSNDITNDQGALTFFFIFLFVTLFVFAGMSVDIARMEGRRVELQNILDSALFAASVNNDSNWTKQEIMDDFFEKSGVIKDEEGAQWGWGAPPWDTRSENVHAWAKLDSPTLFLSLYGFESFSVQSTASVEQRYTSIEISLVVDASESMMGTRMADLRTSVADFAEKMFDIPGVDVHLSIIPFDYQTSAGRNLMTAFHATQMQSIDGFDKMGIRRKTIDEIYGMKSHCVTLERGNYNSSSDTISGGDYVTAALNAELMRSSYNSVGGADVEAYEYLRDTGGMLSNGERLISPESNSSLASAGDFRDRWSAWMWGGHGGSTPFNESRQTFSTTKLHDQDIYLGDGYNDPTCRYTTSVTGAGNGDNSILPFASTKQQVVDYMTNLVPAGSTAGDLGLKWGLALLDPTLRNTVKTLIDGVMSEEGLGVLVPANTIDPLFEGRPANYESTKTLKVLVHMSDGQNTLSQDLVPDFRDIWPVDSFNTSNVFYDENFKTFSIRYTYGSSHRYHCANGYNHVVNSAGYTCRYFLSATAPVGTTSTYAPRELTKRELLQFFTVPDASMIFFNGGTYSDIDASPSRIITGDGGYSNSEGWGNTIADARMQRICDLAASKGVDGTNSIQTYTISFGAGERAETVLRDCVGVHTARAHVAVSGDIGETFDKIVNAITKLRLVN